VFSLDAATKVLIELLLDFLKLFVRGKVHNQGRLTLNLVRKLVDVEEFKLGHVSPDPGGVASLELEVQDYSRAGV